MQPMTKAVVAPKALRILCFSSVTQLCISLKTRNGLEDLQKHHEIMDNYVH